MHPEDPMIEGFLKGDPKILGKIYDQTFSVVFRYIEGRGGSYAEAEDIFQNALITLFVKLKHHQLKVQSFEAYLFTICRNLWRKESVKKRVTNSYTATLLDEALDLAKFSIEQSQWDLYKEKFNALTENCKKLLSLLFQKVSYKEIVISFGYSSETVARQRAFKCKARLIHLIKNDPKYLRLKK